MRRTSSYEAINRNLKDRYDTYLAELKENTTGKAILFSYPLLMKAFSDYEKSKRKILFVGKETYGWIDTMNNVENLNADYIMDCYREFEFAKEYRGRNSPFWRFVRTCHNRINGDNAPNGFLWTNFSKCDSNGTTPNYELQMMNKNGFELILEEIKITKTDTVIFLTGWNYEHQFQRVFNPLQYKTLDENYLYQCIHPALPTHSYMTMHPNGLQFRKKFDITLNRIVDNVASN